MVERELQDELEQLLDKTTLATVIELLANICILKAEHLRTNWQDDKTAKCWDQDGLKLTKLASKLEC